MPEQAEFLHHNSDDRGGKPPKRGKVYLIGAGPGDIELLTLKAVRCIGESDVILLDSLANPDVLQFARKDVHVIHVGKRFGVQSTSQEQIHALMLESASKGLIVARIKGGDPVVFARGGEELQTLSHEQIDVEIVNGITSGIAVPSVLGIPLTHRDYSHEIIFSLGPSFACPQSLHLPDVRDFKFTLVIYMGLNNIDEIAAELLQRGAPPEIPAAAIQSGTLPEQRFVMAPLQSLSEIVANAQLRSPVLIIVGNVVSLSPHYPKPDRMGALHAPADTGTRVHIYRMTSVGATPCVAPVDADTSKEFGHAIFFGGIQSGGATHGVAPTAFEHDVSTSHSEQLRTRKSFFVPALSKELIK